MHCDDDDEYDDYYYISSGSSSSRQNIYRLCFYSCRIVKTQKKKSLKTNSAHLLLDPAYKNKLY